MDFCHARGNEIAALINTNTWEFVLLPTGKKPITGKWVYKVKQLANDSVDCYKARFVAKGFLGVDFKETFSLVTGFSSFVFFLPQPLMRTWNFTICNILV